MVLQRGYLTVAFALTALATAYLAVRDRIPLLRTVVAALGLIVLGRIAWDPRIMGADVGTFPIFNWLLVGYGVPAAAFLAAGRILETERDDLAVRLAMPSACCWRGCWYSSRSATRSTAAIRWPTPRAMSSRACSPS